MEDIETFGGSADILDPLYQRQKEGVAKMRASLLACSDGNLSSATAKQALKNITAMRIYHQIARIIRYLEMMDKIEAKLYASIDATLERSNDDSPSTWMMLVKLQEQLQKTMIESHKLLQPYMELQDIQVMDLIPESKENDTPVVSILPADSREKIRNAANMVLATLQNSDEVEVKEIDADANN